MRRTEQGRENFQRAAVVDSHAAESPVRTGLKGARFGSTGITGDVRRSTSSAAMRGDGDGRSLPGERGRGKKWGQPAKLFLGEQESRNREAGRGTCELQSVYILIGKALGYRLVGQRP